MPKSLFTLRRQATGESQAAVVCDQHAREMPALDGEFVTVTQADDDGACDFCRRRRPAPAGAASVEILIGHEPGNPMARGGWQALAPGFSSGYEVSPWRALADAIWRWHCAGRPPSAGIYFGGPPHPTAVGTVAEAARAAWAARTGARSAA